MVWKSNALTPRPFKVSFKRKSTQSYLIHAMLARQGKLIAGSHVHEVRLVRLPWLTKARAVLVFSCTVLVFSRMCVLLS